MLETAGKDVQENILALQTKTAKMFYTTITLLTLLLLMILLYPKKSKQ